MSKLSPSALTPAGRANAFLRRAAELDRSDDKLAEMRPVIARFRDEHNARIIKESAGRLKKTDGSRAALIEEAETLEAAEVQSFRRFDSDFTLRCPFDETFAAYRRALKENAGADGRHRQATEVWKFSRQAFSHWMDNNFGLYYAGQLRRKAFLYDGERDYPIELCRRCYRLQGWLTEEPGGPTDFGHSDHVGWCEYCLWTEAVVTLGKGALVRWKERPLYFSVGGRYDQALVKEYKHISRGPGRPPFFFPFFGRQRRYEERRLAAWGKALHDLEGSWGPGRPEKGYELWIPERFECEAMDGTALLVHFWASRFRWDGGRWTRAGQKLAQEQVAMPTVFSATLEPDRLASAWYDFRLFVTELNKREWEAKDSAVRQDADERARQLERRQRVEEQRGAASILEP